MKTTHSFRRIALVAATLVGLGTAQQPLLAEDIDLYVGGQAVTGGEVNVLIVLDNTSNFSANNQGFTDEYDADGDGNTAENGTQGSIEIGTLNEVAQTLGDTVNLGLMQYADAGGGYPVFAVRSMTNTTKTVFSSLTSIMKANVGTPQYKGPANADYDDLLNSVVRYFNSFGRYLDLNSQGDLRDYTGNTVPVDRTALGSFGYSGTPSSADYSGNYVEPASADNNCTKNYVIFIGNGYPSQSASSKVTKFNETVALFSPAPTPSSAAIAAADSLGQYAPYWTRFMKMYGVQNGTNWNNITSYAIDVCKNGCDNGSGPNQSTLLKSMAANGGGKYFKSTSKSEIKAALTQIFAEIQAVNSVFASATLPISVNTQGTFENQVYVGVFRPDADARPRWYGNLKEYKFGRYCDADGNDQVLIDSTRALTSGIVTAVHTGTASGTVSGTFSGNVTSASGTVSAVSGTVSGTVTGSTTVYLAAAKTGSSAGTSGSPGTGLGSGTVTGTITGTGTGTGTSTFTGTFNDTPSLTGTYTITDERIGDDVAAATCASGTTLKLYLADKHGYRAIDESGNTGFIDLQARSYWSGASTFWATTPSTTAGSSDLPDGPEVERGGAAFRLRTKWAETATSPNQDGRKVYTCLGTCFAAASGTAARTLSSNVISTTNTEVTGKTELQPPAGSATVALARSGNTVTATATAAHGFSTGNTVTIAGATPTDYNGSKTITVTDTTHFTYTVTEEPDASVVDAATATKVGVSVGINTMTFTPTTAGSPATVTVTTAANHGLIVGSTTTIANAANSALNGTFTVATSDGGTGFTYQVTLPDNPTAETTHGTSVVGTQSETHAAITYTTSACKSGAAAGCFIVESTSNLGNNYDADASVTISGSVPTVYNGTWTISAVGSSCTGVASGNQTKYCVTKAVVSYTSPDTGAGKTASSGGNSEAVSIVRALGNTYATVTATDGAHTFADGDTITVSGASKSQYNGSWVISNSASPAFRISPITLTPSASPTGTITATTGSGTAGPDMTNLLLWTRGKDLWEDEDGNASLANVRASIHGDVLHARPVVVNYGGATGIVGFYGSNDGFLRAVSGGLADTDGAELWSFVPEEFLDYSKLSRRYKNDQLVLYPNTGCSVTSPSTRDYFWDGPVTAYQTSDLATTYIYAGMRRGGRSIYALDVSSPTAPKLLWRISNTKINGTASGDYSELGQTWSEPKVVKLKGTNVGVTETLVALAFGAGYDNTVEEKPVGSARGVTMGRGVYIANATTGAKVALLAAPGGITPYSFAAEVMPLDIDNDGYIDRIYAVDTGGNVYRFDANQTVSITSAGYWTSYIVATVGDVGNDGGTDARKFLFAPEVLPFSQGGQIKVNVLVGSGDREKPLPNFQSTGAPSTLSCTSTNLYSGTYAGTYYPAGTSTTAYQTYKVQDYFFSMIDGVQYGTDPATANADPIVIADLKQINSSTVGTTTLSTGFDVSNPGVYRGWSIVLNNSPNNTTTNNEEKVVNQARVVGGVAFFATSTPALPDVSANICSNLGEARGYAVDPFTGLPAINRTDSDGANTVSELDYSTKFSGGGLPPTVTAGVVTIGGTPYRFVIGSGGSSVTSASSIAGTRSIINLRGTRSRLYWSYGADN